MIITLSSLLICCTIPASDAAAPLPYAPSEPPLVLVQAQNRWGLNDPNLQARLEADLMEILEGPVENTSRSSLSEADRVAIESDPELHEAYRSAPAATLALIGRIRDAGGLKP